MQTLTQILSVQIPPSKKSNFLIWLRRLWWFATIILFATTIVALYANRFSPAVYPIASLLTLMLIPLTVVNGMWLLLSASQRSHAAWFPAIALLWTGSMYGHIFWQPGVPPVYHAADEAKAIRVISFNAGHFYNRSLYSDAYFDKQANREALQSKEWIAGKQADIKCIQEFFDDPQSEIFNTRKTISHNMPYMAFPDPEERHGGVIFFGLIIFSKYPIVNQGVAIKNSNRNIAIFADVNIGSDTLRVVNAHLTSNQFFVHEFTRWHFRRYFQRAIERAVQADSLARFLARSPYPTILCSDLNEIGLSYAYRKLTQEGFTDAFCEAGSGWGTTFRYSRWLVPIRIDYLLTNDRLKPVYYQTHPSFTPNEHNPVEAHYRLTAL